MSTGDISEILQSESAKLDRMVKTASTEELSTREIVDTYRQVINVSSMTKVARQQAADNAVLHDIIANAEKTIFEKFNCVAHPRILASLERSVAKITGDLQTHSAATGEAESAVYDDLRQKMSTREFVEQYDRGLCHA